VIRPAAPLLLAALLAGCPAGPLPPLTTHDAQRTTPPLPPAVLADPSWTFLVRPAALLDASPVRLILDGLGLSAAVTDFFAGAGFDLPRLDWVRIESNGAASLFVLPATQADCLARALDLQQLRSGLPDDQSGPAEVHAVVQPAGDWSVVFRSASGAPPGEPLAVVADDPLATSLAKLLRRVDGAALLFLRRGPFDVRPELDPAGLLAATTTLGCALEPQGETMLRLGCVLFGVSGDNLSTGTLQTLVATVFDSTLGMILDLQGAADTLTYDPEPGAAYIEALLKVEKLLPGLRVIASVPLSHVLEGNPPPP
jgi:hypothetical protein